MQKLKSGPHKAEEIWKRLFYCDKASTVVRLHYAEEIWKHNSHKAILDLYPRKTRTRNVVDLKSSVFELSSVHTKTQT